jgi:quinol monooxygenase YgiN
MLILHVHMQIKPEYVEAFKEATIENARNSVKEPGIARFDFMQQEDDPTRFVLSEVYRSAEASVQHKETAHYAVWAARVEHMFEQPRTRTRLTTIFPGDEGW